MDFFFFLVQIIKSFNVKDVLESMEHHRSVAAQLVESTRSLDCLFSDPGLEAKFQERIVQLQQMINDTRATHRQLLLSAEHWNQFREFASHIEPWLTEATAQLQMLVNKAERGRVSHEDCLQYWVNLLLSLTPIMSHNLMRVCIF